MAVGRGLRRCPMLNVVCVKWGDWCAPHGARYVNNLYWGVRRNLTLEHRFMCFTDDPTGLDRGIEVRPLPLNLKGWWWGRVYPRPRRESLRPLLAAPYVFQRARDVGRGLDEEKAMTWRPVDLRGWYNKLYLFKPGVLEGRCAFIDLDTVIVGSLDETLDYDGDLCILRDFYSPRHYGSGLMAFRAEALGTVWTDFVRQGCPITRGGDQRFIERAVPDADFFQDRQPGQVVSYKLHCARQGVPDYARVVCFHGVPRPHEITEPRLLAAFDGP